MIKKGKDACDYCGRTFRKMTRYTKYDDGSCYHHDCLKMILTTRKDSTAKFIVALLNFRKG